MGVRKIEPISQINSGYPEKDKTLPPKKKGNQRIDETFKQLIINELTK